jgi:predicted PurR-regulated permease PerM
MSVSYIVASIVLAIVLTSIAFVLIGKIEHKGRKINLNWLILMMLIATISILTMVLIYHAQHDISEDAVQNAYEQGVADGKSSATHTLPTNEEMEEWFSSTQEVVVGTNEGGDVAVHIIDGNGEEWVLFADSNK